MSEPRLMCRATVGTIPENLAHKPNFPTTPTSLSLDIIDYKKYFPIAGIFRLSMLVKDMHKTAFQSEMGQSRGDYRQCSPPTTSGHSSLRVN